MNKTILVAGGDLRQVYLAAKLSKYYDVHIFGTNKTFFPDSSVNSIDILPIEKYDIAILPVPVSNDRVTLNTPHFECRVMLSEVADAVKENGIVFGGKFSCDLKKYFGRGIETVDYLNREELNVLNAVATAEGAIQLAMEEIPTTIFRQRILITGFGRISRVLARILTAMGAHVRVAARKPSDIAWADIYGADGVSISNLAEEIAVSDIVFNTAPSMLFGEEILLHAKKNCLIIDLASKPGGESFNKDKK